MTRGRCSKRALGLLRPLDRPVAEDQERRPVQAEAITTPDARADDGRDRHPAIQGNPRRRPQPGRPHHVRAVLGRGRPARRHAPQARCTPTASRASTSSLAPSPTAGLRPPGRLEGHSGARPPALGHGRRGPRDRRPHLHYPAKPAGRQHRQLAHRRGRDDVLSGAGRGRIVLDRRPARQPRATARFPAPRFRPRSTS